MATKECTAEAGAVEPASILNRYKAAFLAEMGKQQFSTLVKVEFVVRKGRPGLKGHHGDIGDVSKLIAIERHLRDTFDFS